MDHCGNRKISFNFIASHSPWQGGIYEWYGNGGIFKSAYRNAIGEETHDIKTLKTLTAECTAVCNSRPLSHVTEEQSWYPLRPTDFLRSTAIIAAPRIKPSELLTSRTDVQENLIKLREYTNEMLDCFWKRWNSEYLLTLREQYKRSNKHPRLEEKAKTAKTPRFILHDDTLKRGKWELGQVAVSTDDFKRTVQVRSANREIIKRPSNRVSPLEISPSDTKQSTSTEAENQGEKETRKASSSHSMTTRSVAKMMNIFTLVTITILFTFFSRCYAKNEGIINSKCLSTVTIAKTIIYADQCMKKEIAITSVKKSHATLNSFADSRSPAQMDTATFQVP
ncbi:hypothetical protein RB195_010604 [Necator americanus]|uniref:DUF5641 domain-containing protein n=1 Tax=Necator americanus TaxID=51031 RepID=A0ABR1D003_NECAM